MTSNIAPAAQADACRRILVELLQGFLALPREIRLERELEITGAPCEPQTPAWHPLILNLLRALCAVPLEVRQQWVDQIDLRIYREVLSPDEVLAFWVLRGLPSVERLVECQRELHQVVQGGWTARE